MVISPRLFAEEVELPSKKEMRFFLHNGHELPNARLVSTTIHNDAEDTADDTNLSLMVMQFGQFLDHDITLTAEADMCHTCNQEPVECCDYYLGRRNYSVEQMPDNCWPIIVPEDDPVFKGTLVT